MIKQQMLNLYSNNNEEKFKIKLQKQLEENGINGAFHILTNRNQILLNSCNIDENAFNQILFKNYIYFLNSGKTFNTEKLPQNDKNIIEAFNLSIKNSNIEDAYNMYITYPVIYHLLSVIYIKDIYTSEEHKINRINEQHLSSTYNNLLLLKNTNLTTKKEDIKIYKKISSK